MKKKILAKVLFYFLGGIAIASFSFYNGFPLINGDTSSYLNAAWEHTVPYERPVFYGWFLKLASLNHSLWFSILVQSFLCFVVLSIAIQKFSSIRGHKGILLATGLTLILTPLGWEANKLLPDVFAGISILLILLFLEAKSKSSWLYLAGIIGFGTFHNSHFVIFGGIAVVLLLLSLLKFNYSRQRLFALIGSSFVCYVLVSLSNYVDHGKWEVGRSSEVFMVGQMAESGMLETILNDNCDKKDWRLCTYIDSLPNRGWKYVWNPSSPVAKLGGWDAVKTEHKDIIHTTLTTPKYWPTLLSSSLIRGFTNCFQLEVGDGIFRCEPSTNIQQSIIKYYPSDSPAAQWNKQNILTIPFSFFTVWHLLTLGLLVLSTLYLWYNDKLSDQQKARLCYALLAILINGWVVAQFANIADRLNTRVFWVLPFMILLTLSSQYRKIDELK